MDSIRVYDENIQFKIYFYVHLKITYIFFIFTIRTIITNTLESKQEYAHQFHTNFISTYTKPHANFINRPRIRQDPKTINSNNGSEFTK